MIFLKKTKFIFYFFFCCFFFETYADLATIDGVLEFFGRDKSSIEKERETEERNLKEVSLKIENKDNIQCDWREKYKRSCLAPRRSEGIGRTDHRYFDIEVRSKS